MFYHFLGENARKTILATAVSFLGTEEEMREKKRKQKESQLMTYTSRGTRHIIRRMKNELNEEKVLGRPFLCLALFLYLGGIGFCCLSL